MANITGEQSGRWGRRKKIRFWLALAGGLLLLLTLLGIGVWAIEKGDGTSMHYQQTDAVLNNPLMGFAPAADSSLAGGDNTLVFLNLTWREWEPQEGEFDWTGINQTYHLDQWKAQGKRVVLRFVCDLPGDTAHSDIPDWLYDKTGDGSYYDISYGQGYAPDYSNPIFIAAHRQALLALSQYLNQDGFLAYVQLGSLGHWGEWHVKSDAGLPSMPSEAICRQYLAAYQEAFPEALLLTRRPYAFAAESGCGVYNDMTGILQDTQTWLDWINQGGTDDQAVGGLAYQAQPDIWESAPVGGEFGSSIAMTELLGEDLQQTLQLIAASHMTFIGPKYPTGRTEDGGTAAADTVLKQLGYRYGVSQAALSRSFWRDKLSVKLTLENYGAAPIYQAWSFCLYLLDAQGQVVERQDTGLDLTLLSPGQQQTVSLSFQTSAAEIKAKNLRVAVGIEDPVSGQPAVQLDMQTESQGRRYYLN
ncbi:MAG: DUF4832 domain-containing protein [Oscillospiraceae bacterium]|nr:DUF4832 domain-containing protein [Oscillospiraceae bacterium]